MKFGLSDHDFNFIHSILNEHLLPDTKVWCFGSRARDDHQEYSDLDLMIESHADQQREIGLINEALENSNIKIKVDIVQQKDFAQSYFENYLKDRVLFE